MTVPEMNAQQTKKWTVVGLGTLLAAGAVGCATPDRIADPEVAPLSPRIVALVDENRRYPEWRNFPRQGTPPPDAVAVSAKSGEGIPALLEALCRRVHRALTMRNLPLGVQPLGDGGFIRPGTEDAEVRRLERPFRKLVVG